jgi:hypothetical protein
MKAIGRWSVASFISIVLNGIKFAIGMGLIVVLMAASILVLFPSEMPTMTAVVPVSFTLDTPLPARIGRTTFGFDIAGPTAEARQDQKGRIVHADGSVKISGRRFITANVVVLVVIMSLGLFVIDELRAVLHTLIHGNPFVAPNATRIRHVAFAVIAGELARSTIIFGENYYARTHLTIAGLQFDAWPHVNVFVIGCGLIILVIAEVFRVGTRLDEEQSLTV